MPSFDEVRFPDNIDRGSKGGPSFMTDVLISASGNEQRIAYWSRPRMRWTVGHSLRTPTEYSELVAVFIARQGRLRGFRYKDWGDFSSAVAGVETKHALLELTATTFQLRKAYTSGSVTVYRNILKPVGDTLTNTAATQANSTVKIYNGGTEITSGWTVSLVTGIVTFDSDPGYSPTAVFSYDIPARFDTDEMQASIDEITYMSWPGIPLIELTTL